uniref:Aquaporin n=2 Tax=Brassica oleracea TaxID=3712 RepID=A0A0D3AHC4_BRAOL|nr:unnamed protein product [Brassica oleracea]
MVAQCLGAICGVGFVKAFQSSYYVRYGGGANSLADGYSTGTSLAVEIIAPSSRPQTLNEVQETPTFQRVIKNIVYRKLICVGSTSHWISVFMGHLATIPITGTGINPARSFGAAVIFNESKPWDDHV